MIISVNCLQNPCTAALRFVFGDTIRHHSYRHIKLIIARADLVLTMLAGTVRAEQERKPRESVWGCRPRDPPLPGLQVCTQTPKHSRMRDPLGEDGPLGLSPGDNQGIWARASGAFGSLQVSVQHRGCAVLGRGRISIWLETEHFRRKDQPSPCFFVCQAW